MSNLSILFWLRASAANKKGMAPLKIRLTLPGKDISDFSSGHTVDVKLWNATKKRVSGNSPEAARVNLYITRSETKLQDIYDDLDKEERDISTEIIKNIFTGKAQQRITILSAIDEHNAAFRIRIDTEGDVEETTLNKFITLREKVILFMENKYNVKDYFINDVKHAFIQDFRTWLLQKGHYTGGPLAPDSATGWMKKLNKITLNLFKRGLIKQNPFIDTKLRWLDPTAESLDETQLQKLEKVVLKLPRLQRVLDRFIVGCYTGMAHSDISAATRSNVVKNFADDGMWIKCFRGKTGEFCKIPILPPVQAIIDKYWNDEKMIAEDRLFPLVGLVSCNDYLKEIAVFAGVDFHLTTHVARHTFAQMALDLGVDIEAIAEILGHADSKTTRSAYLKRSHKFVSNQIQHLKDAKFPQLKVVKNDKAAG